MPKRGEAIPGHSARVRAADAHLAAIRQRGLTAQRLDQSGGDLRSSGAGLRWVSELWQCGAEHHEWLGQVNSDFSLGKCARGGGIKENAELAFRVVFYNAINHSQFATPGTTFRTAIFGVITQTAVAPRLIHFGLKYQF